MEQTDRDAAMERLRVTTDLADLAGCDLVIEAAFEDLEVKRELFAELDRLVAADAILATNTSALSVTEIAAATKRPERVVGMHFFNPAPLMPLVEIVRAELSSDEAVDTVGLSMLSFFFASRCAAPRASTVACGVRVVLTVPGSNGSPCQ